MPSAWACSRGLAGAVRPGNDDQDGAFYVPCAAARSVEDLFDDPQVAAQGLIASYEHPVVGRYRGFRAPIEFGRTAGPEAFAAPAFGQHNAVLVAE